MAISGGPGDAGDKGDIGDLGDEPGHRRDHGEDRDQAGDERDQAGDERDQAAGERDDAADERDEAADQRDQAAEATESGWMMSPAILRSALARREAAADRRRASQDRRAAARERTQAEFDRDIALADRGASAREREYAFLDDLTGAYLRGAGFLELEHEMARARRTAQPLVVAFVDVDGLKAVNDSRGHAAGDRLLIEVARILRANLRSYDLLIRYGGDEFVCAIAGLNVADVTKRLTLVNTALAASPEQGSVTAGLAELEQDDAVADLVARADAALYRARKIR